MNKIIGGVKYDTETAELLAVSNREYSIGGHTYRGHALYQKENGECLSQ